MEKSKIELASKYVRISKVVRNMGYRASDFPNLPNSLNTKNMNEAEVAISKWLNYKPTPLHSLKSFARECGVKAVYYKDESPRFGLGSFKALGGAYAVENLVAKHVSTGGVPSDITVSTATDGNHGRSVSWGAKRAGCKAKIYIHQNVSKSRENAMVALGADVIRVIGNYEASLAACKKDSLTYGYPIVSDTSWDGYLDTPLQIMAGYSVMAKEIISQLGNERPTHAFLPVGVGGLAAGIVAPLWEDMGKRLSKIISVESDMSPCFQASIEAQKPVLIDIKEETLMAGLSCGEVSNLAWDILTPTLTHCISINDDGVAPLMKLLGDKDGIFSIEAGECATAGLVALLGAKKEPKFFDELELDENSIVLVIGTEGATDPEIYKELLQQSNI
jgi:diaminopropionate ammonia-lyase